MNTNYKEDLFSYCASEAVKYAGLTMGVNSIVNGNPKTALAQVIVAGGMYALAPFFGDSLARVRSHKTKQKTESDENLETRVTTVKTK